MPRGGKKPSYIPLPERAMREPPCSCPEEPVMVTDYLGRKRNMFETKRVYNPECMKHGQAWST